MLNVLRLLLLLGFAGVAITALGVGAAWWMDETRRLNRLVNRALGGPADGCVVARGRNAAAGFRRASGKIVVMREGGARAVLYPLKLLIGAELLVDDQVVGRAVRGEARLPLDRIAAAARKVTLRLMFDDAAHPDFALDLWTPRDLIRRDAGSPAQAIVEGRTWLGRAEALVRAASGPAVRRTPAETEPLALTSADRLDEEDEDDEIVLDDAAAQARLL